jgi:hypothetical protein
MSVLCPTYPKQQTFLRQLGKAVMGHKQPRILDAVEGTAPGAWYAAQAFTQSASKAELATFRPAPRLSASRAA